MEHSQAQELIHPYVDGELDAANAEEIAEHMRNCERCRSAELGLRSLRTRLTSSGAAYAAPARLRKSVRAAVRREAKQQDRAIPTWLRFGLPAAALAILLVGFV